MAKKAQEGSKKGSQEAVAAQPLNDYGGALAPVFVYRPSAWPRAAPGHAGPLGPPLFTPPTSVPLLRSVPHAHTADDVARRHRVDDLHPAHHLTEHGIPSIEVRLRRA